MNFWVNETAITRDPELRQIVDRLIPYDPELVILFGSRARGDADAWSDYDLIVVRRTRKAFLHRLAEMAAVRAVVRPDADILVYTPAEWARMQATPFGQRVREEGIVLFRKVDRRLRPRRRGSRMPKSTY
jgi:predicted nucleotidyltransferase